MLRAFSTAATGMSAQQTMVDTVANNLANINTNGFKRSQVNFQDLLYLKMREAGREVATGLTAPSGVEIGSGVRLAATNKIFTMGRIESTGNDLDCAIEGEGFFEVVLPDGTSRYTRDGSFKLNANGYMVNASGYALAGNISIPANATGVDISPDGTVNATVSGANQVVGTIQLVRFPNAGGLSAEGGNLYRETEASGAPQIGTPSDEGYGRLLGSHLERSNVEMVSELVDLISAQRGYEINSRTIRVGDDMLRQLNMLIR